MSSIDFLSLFESLPGLYLVLTPELSIAAVTEAYLHATMTSREAIVGRPLFEVFPDNPGDPNPDGVHNARASLRHVIEHRAADTMAIQKYDIRRPDSDGGGYEERYWSVVNSPVLSATGELLYIIHCAVDVTAFLREPYTRADYARELYFRDQELQAHNRSLRAAHEESQESYRLLADRLFTLREEERKHLALELHDGMGQALTAIRVDLATAQRRLDNGDSAAAAHKIDEAALAVEEAIRLTRRIATDLRPAVLDHLGLAEAIEFHAREFQSRTAIRVRFENRFGDRALSPDQNLAFFRIVQESLTNIARHAQATQVTIELLETANSMRLAIADNGVGFAPPENAGRSLGLLGMEERARTVGAAFRVISSPGQGSRVEVTWSTKEPAIR